MGHYFNKWLAAASICAGLTIVADSHAALVATPGGQAYYDTELDVTWLADANLAASNTFGVSGISASGSMNWSTAMTWISAMNAANYLGYNDWRLPSTGPINGSAIALPLAPSYETYNGTADIGYSISAPGTQYAGSHGSEMAFLYYNTLGNRAYYDFSGTVQIPVWLQNGSGPFSNLDAGYTYWSATTYGSNAWNFDFDFGAQNNGYKTYLYHAWAVRTGNSPLTPVPEPDISWLLVSGLLSLAWRKRLNV